MFFPLHTHIHTHVHIHTHTCTLNKMSITEEPDRSTIHGSRSTYSGPTQNRDQIPPAGQERWLVSLRPPSPAEWTRPWLQQSLPTHDVHQPGPGLRAGAKTPRARLPCQYSVLQRLFITQSGFWAHPTINSAHTSPHEQARPSFPPGMSSFPTACAHTCRQPAPHELRCLTCWPEAAGLARSTASTAGPWRAAEEALGHEVT